jgi:3-oxoacyl-[acyl-carrier protein] reductase
VVLVDLDAARGAEAVEGIEATGRRALFVRTDVRDVGQLEALVGTATDAFGRIDLLANNAGLARVHESLFDVTEEDWDYIHSINARGAFFCLQAVARTMVEQRFGRIVNTASIAALGYRDTTSIAYSASKGAVLTMTQVAAHQLAPFGVTVNAVCPGPTHTEFAVQEWRTAHGRGELTPEQRERLFAAMDPLAPLGRANTPDDVANVVVFLLSDLARNVTGSAYVVDGGIMLR